MHCGESDGEEPFAIGWLSTELLAGVTQRLSKGSKIEAERVDCRLAAVTRALGWRLHRSLCLSVSFGSTAPLQLSAGDLTVELSGSSNDAGAVTRFFVQRARVAAFKVVSLLPAVLEAVSQDGLAVKQAQMQAMATVLSAPHVQLRVLSLEGTATELFGSPATAAALFRRHAASLEQAALGLRRGNAESAELFGAVRACAGLRHFAGRLQFWRSPPGNSSCCYVDVDPSSAISALFVGWPLHSCAITLTSAPDSRVAAFDNFPAMPHVDELHLNNLFFINVEDTMPKLQVLRLGNATVGGCTLIARDYYIYAFFKRADINLSLSIEVDVRHDIDENCLTDLRRCCQKYGLNDVHMECFDAATCAQAGVALPATPPPPLPPQFEHNGESIVVTLQRHGERRHLVLALFILPPPAN